MHQAGRDAERVERPLQQVGDGRLGERAQAQRADGDAELGGGEHRGDVGQRVQHGAGALVAGLGERFDLAASDRDHGELGADEEGVAEQQYERDGELERGHRVRPSSSALRGRSCPEVRSTRTRLVRWRSTASTVNRQPVSSARSPGAGSRPSRSVTSPASVS